MESPVEPPPSAAPPSTPPTPLGVNGAQDLGLTSAGGAPEPVQTQRRRTAGNPSRYRVLFSPLKALGRQCKGLADRLFRGALGRLPIPSETKWQHTLDFIRTFTMEYYEDSANDMSQAVAQSAVARVLSASGRRWMQDLTGEIGTPTSRSRLLERLNLLFRTLDIESSVEARKGEVVVTNHQCPYLAMGLERGAEGTTVCEIICGAQVSFVEGITHGLSPSVEYQPEAFMGRGDPACVKRFVYHPKKVHQEQDSQVGE